MSSFTLLPLWWPHPWEQNRGEASLLATLNIWLGGWSDLQATHLINPWLTWFMSQTWHWQWSVHQHQCQQWSLTIAVITGVLVDDLIYYWQQQQHFTQWHKKTQPSHFSTFFNVKSLLSNKWWPKEATAISAEGTSRDWVRDTDFFF